MKTAIDKCCLQPTQILVLVNLSLMDELKIITGSGGSIADAIIFSSRDENILEDEIRVTVIKSSPSDEGMRSVAHP